MLENDVGAEFLPMKLLAVLVVTSLVLLTAASYCADIIGQSSKTQARACASRIAGTATAEYAESCPGRGTGARIEVSVPGCVRRMVFGAAAADSLRDIDRCTYLLQYVDGSEEHYIAGAPLGCGEPSPGPGGPVVLYPGKYSICVRTGTVNGSIMALIYAEAA